MPKGYPNEVEVPVESLESRLEHLCLLKTEYRANKKEFESKNKHLLESIKSLENIITAEVLELGKTVTVGNIKAEFVPTVKIRLGKAENNESECN